MNTSETIVFNKRLNLYCMNWLKKERGIARVVLVEGYMDAVSLRRHGVEGVVATLGTALTPEQASLMARYAPEIWLSYDGDSAGQKATLRALDILEAQNVRARVILSRHAGRAHAIRANGLRHLETGKKPRGIGKLRGHCGAAHGL